MKMRRILLTMMMLCFANLCMAKPTQAADCPNIATELYAWQSEEYGADDRKLVLDGAELPDDQYLFCTVVLRLKNNSDRTEQTQVFFDLPNSDATTNSPSIISRAVCGGIEITNRLRLSCSREMDIGYGGGAAAGISDMDKILQRICYGNSAPEGETPVIENIDQEEFWREHGANFELPAHDTRYVWFYMFAEATYRLKTSATLSCVESDKETDTLTINKPFGGTGQFVTKLAYTSQDERVTSMLIRASIPQEMAIIPGTFKINGVTVDEKSLEYARNDYDGGASISFVLDEYLEYGEPTVLEFVSEMPSSMRAHKFAYVFCPDDHSRHRQYTELVVSVYNETVFTIVEIICLALILICVIAIIILLSLRRRAQRQTDLSH